MDKHVRCVLQKQPLGADHYEELGFEIALQRYVYNYESHTFQKLSFPVQVLCIFSCTAIS